MRLPPPNIVKLERRDFLDNYWDYHAGEHVTLIGRTGSGKTYLANQLLVKTATPELPAVVLVMKPRDTTADKLKRDGKYRRIFTWPPPPSIWNPGKKAGYLLWPRHTFNPTVDNEQHAAVFSKAMMDCYKKGHYIVFGDELYSLSAELGLDPELICLWTKGRSMGTSLWGATQKPTHVPLWAYNQATHLFLAYEQDRRARDRYAEIGGVDP